MLCRIGDRFVSATKISIYGGNYNITLFHHPAIP